MLKWELFIINSQTNKQQNDAIQCHQIPLKNDCMKTSQQVYIGRNKDGKEEVSRKIEFFISRLELLYLQANNNFANSMLR